MSNSNIMFNYPRQISRVIINHVQRRHMPVNVPPTATGKRRFRLEVETDPHKLVNYCCGLNYQIDQPPIKLKPDSEYPDWLWQLRIGPKPSSYDMEKGTKDYYLRLAEEGKERNYLLRMKAAKPKKTVAKHILSLEEYKYRLRFAALAHLEEDAGFDQNSTELDWWALTGSKRLNVREYYLPVEKDRVIYADKIPGNTYIKNYFNDPDSTFSLRREPKKIQPLKLKAVQDSQRRHQYAST